jgi:hypothetical protein
MLLQWNLDITATCTCSISFLKELSYKTRFQAVYPEFKKGVCILLYLNNNNNNNNNNKIMLTMMIIKERENER